MVVPDDHTGVSQYRLSSRLVRTVSTFAALVLVVLVSLAAGFFVKEGQRLEADRLAQANALLVQEVERIRGDLATLEGTLADLSSKDEHYRLLANLEPLDEDVKLAGVGGPGSRTLEGTPLWQVDRELAEITFGTGEDLSSLIRRAQLLSSSWTEATDSMAVQVDIWQRTPSIIPLPGEEGENYWTSSRFSKARQHPILNVTRPHKGIDVVARRGTEVMAAAKGTIRYAGNTGGDYGYMVEIDHGRGIVTRYAHLGRGSLTVKRGQVVERGEKIAEVGMTGLVTSPSLHYEVIENGRPQDPAKYVLGDVIAF